MLAVVDHSTAAHPFIYFAHCAWANATIRVDVSRRTDITFAQVRLLGGSIVFNISSGGSGSKIVVDGAVATDAGRMFDSFSADPHAPLSNLSLLINNSFVRSRPSCASFFAADLDHIQVVLENSTIEVTSNDEVAALGSLVSMQDHINATVFDVFLIHSNLSTVSNISFAFTASAAIGTPYDALLKNISISRVSALVDSSTVVNEAREGSASSFGVSIRRSNCDILVFVTNASFLVRNSNVRTVGDTWTATAGVSAFIEKNSPWNISFYMVNLAVAVFNSTLWTEGNGGVVTGGFAAFSWGQAASVHVRHYRFTLQDSNATSWTESGQSCVGGIAQTNAGTNSVGIVHVEDAVLFANRSKVVSESTWDASNAMGISAMGLFTSALTVTVTNMFMSVVDSTVYLHGKSGCAALGIGTHNDFQFVLTATNMSLSATRSNVTAVSWDSGVASLGIATSEVGGVCSNSAAGVTLCAIDSYVSAVGLRAIGALSLYYCAAPPDLEPLPRIISCNSTIVAHSDYSDSCSAISASSSSLSMQVSLRVLRSVVVGDNCRCFNFGPPLSRASIFDANITCLAVGWGGTPVDTCGAGICLSGSCPVTVFAYFPNMQFGLLGEIACPGYRSSLCDSLAVPIIVPQVVIPSLPAPAPAVVPLDTRSASLEPSGTSQVVTPTRLLSPSLTASRITSTPSASSQSETASATSASISLSNPSSSVSTSLVMSTSDVVTPTRTLSATHSVTANATMSILLLRSQSPTVAGTASLRAPRSASVALSQSTTHAGTASVHSSHSFSSVLSQSPSVLRVSRSVSPLLSPSAVAPPSRYTFADTKTRSQRVSPTPSHSNTPTCPRHHLRAVPSTLSAAEFARGAVELVVQLSSEMMSTTPHNVTASWARLRTVRPQNSTTFVVVLDGPEVVELKSDSAINITLPGSNFWCGSEAATCMVEVKAVPEAIPYVVKQAVQIASATAVAVASVGGCVAVAAQQARLSAIFAIASCEYSHTEPLDPFTSPTQMRFGPATGQYYRGAVVGNVIVMVGIPLVLLAFGMAVTGASSVTERPVERVWRAMGCVSLPGVAIIPYAILAQGTASAAVSTWRYGTDATDPVVGLFGILFLFGVLASVLLITTRCFGAVFDAVPLSSSRLRALLLVTGGKWHDCEGSSFKRHFRHLFSQYRPRAQYYICTELIFSVSLGVLDGVKPSKQVSCNMVAGAVLLILALFMSLFGLVRPYTTMYLQLQALLSSFLTFLCAMLAAIGHFADYGPLLDASEYVATIALVLGLLQSCADTYRLVMYVRSKWCHSSRRRVATIELSASTRHELSEALQAPAPPSDVAPPPTVTDDRVSETELLEVLLGSSGTSGAPLSLADNGCAQPAAPLSEEAIQRMHELDDVLNCEGGSAVDGPAGAFTITSGGVEECTSLLVPPQLDDESDPKDVTTPL